MFFIRNLGMPFILIIAGVVTMMGLAILSQQDGAAAGWARAVPLDGPAAGPWCGLGGTPPGADRAVAARHPEWRLPALHRGDGGRALSHVRATLSQRRLP
ncbi:hypothetical protein [Pseudomonas sp. OHS18]|uniref:hypothetical protein n=1 Tax=Pseudomonas sp. OHS18 TaxID=3399679 RepID=UPI003A87680A